MMTALAIVRATMSYPLFVIVAALVLALLAATLGKRPTRARVIHSSYLAVTGVLSVIAGSWLMYLIHG